MSKKENANKGIVDILYKNCYDKSIIGKNSAKVITNKCKHVFVVTYELLQKKEVYYVWIFKEKK